MILASPSCSTFRSPGNSAWEVSNVKPAGRSPTASLSKHHVCSPPLPNSAENKTRREISPTCVIDQFTSARLPDDRNSIVVEHGGKAWERIVTGFQISGPMRLITRAAPPATIVDKNRV